MPHEFDEATVREYWGYCGNIAALDMLVFPDTGNFNGVMFITFATEVRGGEEQAALHADTAGMRGLPTTGWGKRQG